MLGGELGDTIIPGDPDASELIYRIHLEVDDDEHMPPGDKPQPTGEQKDILEWWITRGSPSEVKLAELDIPLAIKIAIMGHLSGSTKIEEQDF